MSVYERFLTRVDAKRPAECWLWTGPLNMHGYGYFMADAKKIAPHRWIYQTIHGPIPAGLQIDHLCRVRNCVNPSHMEAVTLKENVLRGDGITAQNARKTECDSGHTFDEANTLRAFRRGRWVRECRACARERFYRRKGGNSGSTTCACGREFASAKARATHERACSTFHGIKGGE